jgi:hypothetical protein
MEIFKVNLLVMVRTKLSFWNIKDMFKDNPYYNVIEIKQIQDMQQNISPSGRDQSIIVYEAADDIAIAEYQIRKFRQQLPQAKLMVLSPHSSKESIVRLIRSGMNSFVIQPYKAEYFKERIVELANSTSIRNIEVVAFDLRKYLVGEMIKARKGDYPVTFVLATITIPEKDNQTCPGCEYTFFLNKMAEAIAEICWETDLYFRLNPKHLLGIFPFCNVQNSKLIIQKIEDKYNDVIRSNQLPTGYQIVTVSASYPEDASSMEEIVNSLSRRMKTKIPDDDAETLLPGE